MNRIDILSRRRIFQAEKNRITGAVLARLDAETKDKSVRERQNALLYGGVHTEEERRQLGELDEKINGITHMLEHGFFQEKATPEKDEKEEELY